MSDHTEVFGICENLCKVPIYAKSQVNTLLNGKANTSHNHDGVYSPTSHNHDSRYYTETEVDTLLAGKASSSHNHDDRYYTESEVDTLLNAKVNTSDTALVKISQTQPSGDNILWVK